MFGKYTPFHIQCTIQTEIRIMDYIQILRNFLIVITNNNFENTLIIIKTFPSYNTHLISFFASGLKQSTCEKLFSF